MLMHFSTRLEINKLLPVRCLLKFLSSISEWKGCNTTLVITMCF